MDEVDIFIKPGLEPNYDKFCLKKEIAFQQFKVQWHQFKQNQNRQTYLGAKKAGNCDKPGKYLQGYSGKVGADSKLS